MRSHFLVAVIGCLVVAAPAASAQHASHAGHAMQHATSGWKEMDAFHTFLMDTWHPAEKGDFAPARAKAAAMNVAARAWAESTPPTSCATPGVKQSIAAISAATSALTARVKTDAPDRDLREILKGIHDRFEAVEKSCKPADR